MGRYSSSPAVAVRRSITFTRRVISVLLPLFVAFTLLYSLANPALLLAAANGMLLSWLLFWRLRRGLKPLILVVGFTIFALTACEEESVVETQVDVTFDATLSLGSEHGSWVTRSTMTVPAKAICFATHGYPCRHDTSIDLDPTDKQFDQDLDLLKGWVKGDGWTLKSVRNGEDAVFIKDPPVRTPVTIPSLPLSTTFRLSYPEVKLPPAASQLQSEKDWPVVLTADLGSHLKIDTPRGAILRTSPLSESKATPSGEERLIQSVSWDTHGLEILLVSPLARRQPLSSLVETSFWNAVSWITTGGWLLVLTAMQEEIREWIGSHLFEGWGERAKRLRRRAANVSIWK